MNYDIDVHIIRPYVFDERHIRWLDQCVASLEGEPVNLHFPYYVEGDIRAARDAVGYYWRIREDGAHRIYDKDIAESLKVSMQHMNAIRQQLLIKR